MHLLYLIGKSLDDAKSSLKKAKLKTGDVSYEFSDTYAEGEVMWQQYDSGERLEKNTSVKLTVSKGPQPTTTTQAPQPTPPPTEVPDIDE